MKLWLIIAMVSALGAAMSSWAVLTRSGDLSVQVKLLTGKQHTIKVSATDTGAQVRERIAQLTGIKVDQILLLARDRFIRYEDNAVAQLGETRELSVILRVRGGGGLGTATVTVPSTTRGRLRVQWIEGTVYEIESIPNETVGELKERLAFKFKTPVEQLRLIAHGREWLDMEQVDDIGYVKLHVLLRMRRGYDVTGEAVFWGAAAVASRGTH